MSTVQRFAASSFTASWSILPNEVKSKIVRHLDLASALALMRCGQDEAAVVREFCSFDVDISVKYLSKTAIFLYIDEKPKNTMAQYWIISEEWKGSLVEHFEGSKKPISIVFHEVPFAKMTFSIVGRLMSERMFVVNCLEFKLPNYYYDGLVDLNLKKIVDVKYLVLTDCSINTIKSVLRNEMIKPSSWDVNSECMNLLRWSKQRISEMCGERELESRIFRNPFTIVLRVCPPNE